jgi:hypothetical protein
MGSRSRAISARRALVSLWPDLLLMTLVLGAGAWRLRALLACEHGCLQDYSTDLPYEFYTIHSYAHGLLHQGSFPLWDPHIMAGHPVGAQFGNSLFYPPLLLWLLLAGPGTYTPRADELLLLLHLIAAGGAVYGAARILRFGRVGALVAGLLYCGMPQSLPMLQWSPMVYGIPWVPLVLASWLRLAEARRIEGELPSLWVLAVAGTMLITAAHPNLPAYAWLSMGAAGAAVLLRDGLTRRRDPKGLARHGGVLVIAAAAPVALAAVYVLPLLRDLPLLARQVLPFHPSMGDLSPALAWELIFPGASELGLVGFGPLALGLALGSSLFLGRRGSVTWTLPLLAGLWLLYLPEGSPLFEGMRPIPLMGTLRYSTRAVVVVAGLLALIAGEAAGAIVRAEAPGPRFRPQLGWVLVISLAVVLLWAQLAAPVSAERLAAAGGHGPATLALGLLSVPVLLGLSQGPRTRMAAAGVMVLLASAALWERDRWAPVDLAQHELAPLEPHATLVDRAIERFPEVFAQPSIQRHADWGHHNIVPYWTGTHASSGLTWPWLRTVHTASPANYYSLWSEDWPGTKASFYTKLSPSLDAGVYDLLGVRWFLFPDHREWVYLSRRSDYYDGVEDEWAQLDLGVPTPLRAVKAELACGFVDFARGRLRLELDGQPFGDPVDAEPDERLVWWLHGLPVQRLRLIMVRRGMSAADQEVRDLALGCSLSELHPLGELGHPVTAEDLVVSTSSSGVVGGALMDGDASTGWRPDLQASLDQLLTRGQVRKVRDGLYENLDVLPRALLVYDWALSQDPQASWRHTRSDDFDPRRVVWFAEDPGLPEPPDAAGTGRVELTRYEPNLIELELATDRPALLLLGELACQGWRAWVDGESRPILTADGAFRAIYQEAGEHRVRLVYRPPGLVLGAWISLAALLLLLVLSVARWRRADPARETPSLEAP